MLGVFRRRLRHDHLTLLNANLQMGRALYQSYRAGLRLGAADDEASDLAAAFKEALAASLAAARYLDRHDHLSPGLADEQLQIYQALKLHLDAHEAGRATARARPEVEAGASAPAG